MYCDLSKLLCIFASKIIYMNCKYKLTKESYLNLYLNGKSDLEIAKELGMSHGQVSKFRRNVLKIPLVRDIIELTKEEEEILVGTLLGDSNLLYIYSTMKKPAFSFTHTAKNEEYFMQKYNKLSKILSSFGRYASGKTGYSRNDRFCAIGKSLLCMNKYRHVFYPNNKKIIPIDFLNDKFTAQSLAYLFMDDGNRNSNTINLNLQCFEIENLNEFIEFMKNKFNLEFTIKKDKTLYLRYRSTEIFYNLVIDYISKDMQYKLDGIRNGLNIK